MGSYAQQYGPGPVWYYEEPPRQAPPPHPVVPVRYSNHSGDMFNQPTVYTTYPPTDPVPTPIQNPATSFGTPNPFDRPSSSARKETSPVSVGDRSDRRRYRIKRIRTACEECRKRKQRCDGSEYCGPCMEQGTHCRYRDIPPAKKDAMIQKMLDLVERHSEYLETITEDIDGINRSLKDVEKRLPKQK